MSNRKKIISGKNPLFALMTHLMSPLSPQLKNFEIPKMDVFAFFSFLYLKYSYSLIFGFLPSTNWPDFGQKWSK